jgi:amylosucrase
VHYLGHGVHHGKVSDLAYHNSLMVQIWSSLASRDVRLAAQALHGLPPIPSSTAWVTYLRCHDDIGWAIDDGDAAAVGLSGYAHRAFLSDYYAGELPGSPARGVVFQHNPLTGDRRISGTAAALAGLDAALASGNAAGVNLAVARLLLAHAVILGWGGVPVLWMGDELGLGNDPNWAAEEGHAEDNRWVHRPRMSWTRAGRREDPSSVTGRLFTGIAHLAAVRAGLVQLHAAVPAEVVEVSDPGVLPVLRRHPVGPMLGLYNVTETWRPWPAYRVQQHGVADPINALSGDSVRPGDDGNLWLPPYAAWWLVDRT